MKTILRLLFFLLPAFNTVAQTNDTVVATNTPALDNIPLINMLPEKWRGWALALVALSPFITRGIYALRNGGGIKGFFSSVWIGTNVPKELKPLVEDAKASKESEADTPTRHVGVLLLISALSFGLLSTTGCTLFSPVPRTPEAKRFDSYKTAYSAARESYKTFKRECYAGRVTAANEAKGDQAWDEFRKNYEIVFKLGNSETTATADFIALKDNLVHLLLTL